MLQIQPGEIKHLLSFFVVPHLAEDDDPIAVRRLKRRIDRFDFAERFQRRVMLFHAMQINAKDDSSPVNRFRIDLQRSAAIRLDRLVESFHLIQRQPDVEKPGAVIWIDCGRRLQLFERFLPSALLE